MNVNMFASCCGAYVLSGFDIYNDEKEALLVRHLTAYGKYLMTCVLADHQVGFADNPDRDGVGIVDESWVPALKRHGFKFVGRAFNPTHKKYGQKESRGSLVYVFHRYPDADTEAETMTPPPGWED